ncbi:hypothetical protein Tco_0827167 [Tanacetum coccineum]
MNPQETQQVDGRDEKWVSFTERVKISSTNVRLETTLPQKEETFQVQFWYTIKKVQGTDSYESLLANKKCVINADVFRTILDICLRLEGVDFTDVLDDDATLAFLIKLGYKGENVDYPELIWEDLDFQIDHEKEKRSRRKNMPFPRFTKIPPPKKSKGKGSQRKKTADESQETVDVTEESKPKPELVKRKTSSKRRVKKKVTLSDDDNIISDDSNTALELGKSISKNEVEEAEAARHVHATHARIMTKSVPEPTKRRKSGKVTSDPPKKLKGVPSLTPEQEVADIMQALKESKKTSKRHPGTRGSSEGTSTIPGVPDESTVVSATSSEGTGDADDEDDEIESNEDDINKYTIRDEEVTNAAKADAEKTLEAKDDAKKTKLLPTSSILYVSLSFEPSVLTPVQESPSKAIVTTLHPPSVSTTPYVPQQTTTPIPTPIITTEAPIITTAISESDALSVVQLRVAKLEKDMFDLKKIDLFVEALVSLKTQVPSVVDNYLRSKVRDVFQKELKKHTAALKEYDQESALCQTMHANKSFNRIPTNHRLYHALIEALIEDENAMDKGVADTVQDHKRKHDDDEDDNDEDPPAGPNQGKQTKRRRTKDSKSFKKPSTTKETPKGKALSKGSKTSHLGHLTIDADYFFNNDLEYLKSSDPERTYTTSITKTKVARYEIKGIKDMLSTLWSPTKVGYDKDALKGIKHWGERRKLWHRSQLNEFSKHNVYSTKKIIGVKSVSVKKLHRYGHLEEIVVKNANRPLYKFKEGDFVDLYMNDIEDMLLLVVQPKLFHLTDSDIVDFIMALCMTLKKVRDELHHRVLDFDLRYNKEMERRKWTAIDKKRSALMVELINKQMRKRMIIQNLERLVGARELEMDYKLMTHTI